MSLLNKHTPLKVAEGLLHINIPSNITRPSIRFTTLKVFFYSSSTPKVFAYSSAYYYFSSFYSLRTQAGVRLISCLTVIQFCPA